MQLSGSEGQGRLLYMLYPSVLSPRPWQLFTMSKTEEHLDHHYQAVELDKDLIMSYSEKFGFKEEQVQGS